MFVTTSSLCYVSYHFVNKNTLNRDQASVWIDRHCQCVLKTHWDGETGSSASQLIKTPMLQGLTWKLQSLVWSSGVDEGSASLSHASENSTSWLSLAASFIRALPNHNDGKATAAQLTRWGEDGVIDNQLWVHSNIVLPEGRVVSIGACFLFSIF